jgi:hypothetical protein
VYGEEENWCFCVCPFIAGGTDCFLFFQAQPKTQDIGGIVH